MGHHGPSALGQVSGQQPVLGCNNWVLRNWDRVGQGISLSLIEIYLYALTSYPHTHTFGP